MCCEQTGPVDISPSAAVCDSHAMLLAHLPAQAVSVTVAGKENVRPSQVTAAAAAAAVATGADSGGDRYALTAAAATGAGATAIVGAEEGPDMNFLPPNMPGFSELDLQFICTFTEVGVGRVGAVHNRHMLVFCWYLQRCCAGTEQKQTWHGIQQDPTTCLII